MKVVNRRFHREYQLLESFEAGIVLTGAEAKTVHDGNIRLDEAFVRIMDGEAYLINAEIPIYKYARPQGYDPRRSRKLLLHRREILKLQVKLAGGGNLTLAPVSCYNKGRRIKLEIALARGRREREKTKLVKQRDIARDQAREAKEYTKM